MPAFRKQMQVKKTLLGGPGVRTFKRGQRSKALKANTIWDLVLYHKTLFGEQIYNCNKEFLFNKLTYQSPSYAATPCISINQSINQSKMYFPDKQTRKLQFFNQKVQAMI